MLTGAGIVGVVLSSLRSGPIGSANLGLDAWRRVLADPGFRDAFGFTVWVATASTITATILAVPAALALRGNPQVRAFLALPIAVPHLVVASMASLWISPGGIADRLVGAVPVTLIGDRNGLAVIAVYVWKELPFLVVLLAVALDRATAELEQTAALVGAGPWRRFVDVVLPRIAGPLAGGAMVIAAFVIGAVEVPLVVGPTRPATLGTYAIDAVRVSGPQARADAAVAEIAALMLIGLVGVSTL
ncbi:MAG: ABC transporter permease subunit, partial [Ilumatobacteraceae bacterium]